jgi:hypothetical protein
LKGNLTDSTKNLHAEVLSKAPSQQKLKNLREIDPALDYQISKTDKEQNHLDNKQAITRMINQENISDNNGKVQQFRYQSKVLSGTQQTFTLNQPSEGQKLQGQPITLQNNNITKPNEAASKENSKNTKQEVRKPEGDRGLILGLSQFVKTPTSGQTITLRPSDQEQKPAISYEKPLTVESLKNTPGKSKEETTYQGSYQGMTKVPMQTSLTATNSPKNYVKSNMEQAGVKKLLNLGTIHGNAQLPADLSQLYNGQTVPLVSKPTVLTSTPDKSEGGFEQKKKLGLAAPGNQPVEPIELFSSDGKDIKQSRRATPTSSSQKQQNVFSPYAQPSTFEPILKFNNQTTYYQTSEPTSHGYLASRPDEHRFIGTQTNNGPSTNQGLDANPKGYSVQERALQNNKPAYLNSASVKTNSKSINVLTLKPTVLDQTGDMTSLKPPTSGSFLNCTSQQPTKLSDGKNMPELKLPSFEQCKLA